MFIGPLTSYSLRLIHIISDQLDYGRKNTHSEVRDLLTHQNDTPTNTSTTPMITMNSTTPRELPMITDSDTA